MPKPVVQMRHLVMRMRIHARAKANGWRMTLRCVGCDRSTAGVDLCDDCLCPECVDGVSEEMLADQERLMARRES